MKIVAEMTSDEFQEFMSWRKDKQMYDRELEKLAEEYELMGKKVLWAVEPDPKKPGKFKIVDQDHMAELHEMAQEVVF